MIYLDLFLGFLKVGCFSFGGAFAAIPLIRDVVTEYGWRTDEALTNMIAVGESTPGPIMVNLATYVGSSRGGLIGAILATGAVVLPAFVILLLIVGFMAKVIEKPVTQAVLNGLKACVIGVILVTGAELILNGIFRNGAVNGSGGLVAVLLAGLMFGGKKLIGKQIPVIGLIGIAAILGVCFL